MKQVIVFSIDQQNFALDLSRVSSILEYTEPTPVPNSHDSISGVINVRGDIHTIIDGSKILNGNINKEDSRIILLDDAKKVGLHVQDTSNVLTVEPEHIKNETGILGSNSNLVKQVIDHDGIIIEIDIDEILTIFK